MSIDVTVDPEQVAVRDSCDLEITVQTDQTLEQGATISWQLPHSWSALRNGPTYTKEFQTTDSLAAQFVEATAPEATFDVDIRTRHLPDTEMATRHGRQFVATLTSGRVAPTESISLRVNNTNAPYLAGTEPVWISVNGEQPQDVLELTTRPGPATNLRVLVPSTVRPGEPFDVQIVSLDRFDNASATEYVDESLELTDGTVVERDLCFTGARRIPVALDEFGIHRFRFTDELSNAVKVTDTARGPYWGDTHIHTGISHDGQGNDPYGYARDVSGLDFAAVTDHIESLGERGHGRVLDWANAANDPGQFVSIPAYEITLPEEYNGCHYNFYFRSVEHYRHQADREDVPMIVGDGTEEPEALSPEELLCMPHHTGINAYPCDITDCENMEYVPAAEIYSHHGQSETYAPQHVLAYEFNRLRKPERRVNHSVYGPHYLQDFWKAGYRLGAIGSSDDHTGQGGRPTNGVAAVFAEDLSRDGILDGLQSRECYATTGERMLLDFSVANTQMGQEGTVESGTDVEIALDVWGTDLLLDVEVLRYRFDTDEDFQPVVSEAPNGTPAPISGDDASQTTPNAGNVQRSETLDTTVTVSDTVETDCVYYARITQAPLERPGMAWSSPVWITVE